MSDLSDRDEVYERVKSVLIEVLDADEEEVFREAYLVEDLDVDSLDRINLDLALEDEFGRFIGSENIFSFRSVNEILDFLNHE